MIKKRIPATAESTINDTGLTTVPADIRAHMKAKPGTRLAWSVMTDGTVIVRAKTKSILDLAGMLKPTNGERVSIEDMKVPSGELDLQPALRQMHQWGLDNGDLGYAYWHEISKLLISTQALEARLQHLEVEVSLLRGANEEATSRG